MKAPIHYSATTVMSSELSVTEAKAHVVHLETGVDETLLQRGSAIEEAERELGVVANARKSVTAI